MQQKLIVSAALLAASLIAQNGPSAAKARLQFPDAPGKGTVQKVCGTCHGAEVVVPKGMTRQQWGDVIASMVTRGAKGTDEEFAQVLDYLATNFPPPTAKPASPMAAATKAPARHGPAMMGAGADDKHVVDVVAAARGRAIYIAECITCHGNKARGTANGADLVRSITVLHDRYGSVIGPFLHAGHRMQSGRSSSVLTAEQIDDLSHFLHGRVYDTLRSGPNSQVINVLTGNAAAGREYFNGPGRCASCHSTTGDLAGIANRYDPPMLQQRLLFPQTIAFGRGGRPVPRSKSVTVTVTTPDGKAVSGTLLSLDDFNVALRDAAGEYHSWKRTPELKVDKHDPYAAHVALLDQYTDTNIHDIVAYLETLK